MYTEGQNIKQNQQDTESDNMMSGSAHVIRRHNSQGEVSVVLQKMHI
jgi:hypothetical protein